MTKQFTHTTMDRRSSIVYSTSVGKGGLFTPADYIPSEIGNSALEEESDDAGEGTATRKGKALHGRPEEYQSLLDANNSRTLQREAEVNGTVTEHSSSTEDGTLSAASLPKKLIDEERDLLIDNHILQGRETLDTTSSAANNYGSTEPEVVVDTWEEALENGKIITTTYRREGEVLACNALPLIFTFILQNSLSLASIFSVSHLGTKELGGVTLGSMTANITGLAAIQGLCTCLDTLCSQAYGAKNYHVVGLFVQRCAVITMLAFLPIMYIWVQWSETILSWLVPEPELCRLAANYLKVAAFGVPGFVLFECGKRFLQCQGIFHASTIVLFVCAPLNALMNYFLVWDKRIGIGYLGAPLSVSINYWFMAIGLFVYTIFTKQAVKPLKCWNGVIKPHQVFRNWRKMINLALPGILMVETEFLGFEILTIFASHLGPSALGAQSIISTIASLAYQVPFSISVSTSTRVANFIGASLYQSCIKTCTLSLLLSFACSSMNMLIIFLFRKQIAGLFSTEPEVVDLVTSALPILAFMQIFDAFNASTAGCLRGQGRQKIGGFINMFAFYAIGIPMAVLLTFNFNLGVGGLWYGITCALIVMSVCQGYAVFHCDWNEIIDAAKSRNSETVRV
ncbi:hypothetical protein HG535_0A04640 [Zygotorulaspora mrakii]|uniref:Uncharacterized protein n=1 Tax=Zygotorulaspora mrakii TaxID=42260 RepID=A0A7H9AWQ1_ZYGMR|nr:uncharacterized protein HG535_0A04640 [Zygotorulaspora mrakii]QLG70524.1 hypothetical protein HG535_0A04640 [Zygotorulaspora mrakii]